jgi:RND family efflux transporter MFP subunit
MKHTRVIAKYTSIALFVLGAPVAGAYLAQGGSPQALAASPVQTNATTIAREQAPGIEQGFVGVLLPEQMATLTQRAEGRVLRVSAKLGQAVHKGDILMEIDPRDSEHALAIAKAGLKSAQASAGAAGAAAAAAHNRAARRNVMVGNIAIVSAEEAAQSVAEAQTAGGHAAAAAAEIEQQKARVEQLKLALEETRVVAPFDGVVSTVYFEPGSTVHPGDPVVRVVGGSGLRVRFAIPEDAAAMLRASRSVHLRFDTREAFASVDQIAPELDVASRTYLVEGTIIDQARLCPQGCTFLAGQIVRAYAQ